MELLRIANRVIELNKVKEGNTRESKLLIMERETGFEPATSSLGN